jgi:hypothetical protein
MRYIKHRQTGQIYSTASNVATGLTDDQWVEKNVTRHGYTEVDAQGNPLNAVSGSNPSVQHASKCAKLIGLQCTCGAEVPTITPFGVTWTAAPDTIPPVKQNLDQKEEALRAKILPKFNGEARCQPPKPPQNYPIEPYFHDNPERNAQSERVLRRFLTTNMREWPVCRWSRQPMELRIEGKTMRDDPYGGEKAEPRFYCPDCGVWS